MRSLFSSIVLSLILSAGLTFAAELVTVHPTYITTPNGTESGSLVMSGNQILFVDNTTPANSFAIPRSQILSTSVTNGVVTLSLASPFVSPLTSASTVVFQPMDGSGTAVAAWASATPGSGVPVTAQNLITTQAAATYDYPAKYDGHEGTLEIRKDAVGFQADNPKDSIAWNYDVVRKIETVPDRNEVRLKLHGGDTETFHIVGGQTVNDAAVQMAMQRVAAAPHYHE